MNNMKLLHVFVIFYISTLINDDIRKILVNQFCFRSIQDMVLSLKILNYLLN